MLPHHIYLESQLQSKTKAELLQLISNIYQASHGKSAWELFGDLIYAYHLNRLDPVTLRQHVDTFYQYSMAEKYYAPFDMHSGNFMNIPEETDIWFYEVELLLYLSCELVIKKKLTDAKYCLERLLDLIERLGDDVIVFAHEYGEWMINCKHDYRGIYQALCQEPS